MTKYTLYIVARNANHHYPVIMANNGKACFNEPVTRANKLEISAWNFIGSCEDGFTAVQRITEKEFKKLFPNYAPNKGGKKKAAIKPTGRK